MNMNLQHQNLRHLLEWRGSPVAGDRIIIVGTSRVARQHRLPLKELGFAPLSDDDDNTDFTTPSGKRWVITTWEGASANPINFKREVALGTGDNVDSCYSRVVY